MGKFGTIVAILVLAGCMPAPPESPMEQRARLAMAAQYAVQNCGGYLGGYDAARRLREDANQSIVTARNLGATDAVFAKAKADIHNAFTTAVIFTDRQVACNDLVSSIAWNA